MGFLRSLVGTILLALILSSSSYGALDVGIEWDVRTTGNADNGGGYDQATDGGTDYSEQDAAELTLTDLATSGIGVTTLTSVTGGFTAAMIDNIIQIKSGTNATVGYYEIDAYTDGNTVTLDRAPDDGVGGIDSDGVGSVGGCLLTIDAAVDALVANNKVWIEFGSYGETVSCATNGAKDAGYSAIVVEGWKASKGDTPTGADRPVIDGEDTRANCITASGSKYHWKNLIIEDATDAGIDYDSDVHYFINCRITNHGSDGIYVGGNGDTVLINTEIDLNTGWGYQEGVVGGASHYYYHSYIHDNTDGGHYNNASTGSFMAIGTVWDTNGNVGVYDYGWKDVHNCVFFNNTGSGIGTRNYGSCGGGVVLNSIFRSNGAYGIDRADDDQGSFWVDNNCYSNNTTAPLHYITSGANDITDDPTFESELAGDFTLKSGSPCLDTGMQVGTDQGITGDYKVNIGPDQDDNAAGGATTDVFGWVD